MEEINSVDTENAKPNESEGTSTRSGSEDSCATPKLSLPLENIPDFIENSERKTIDEFNESKTEETKTFQNKSNVETEKLQIEHPKEEPLIVTQNEPPDDEPDEKSPEICKKESVCENETEATQDSNVKLKCVENEVAQNQSLIDDTEDLLVPTDFVPDISDIISDESKRKHSYHHHDDDESELCKKFKHDNMTDEDISMQTETIQDHTDEMCVENAPQTSPEKTNEIFDLPEKCEMVNEDLSIADILIPKGNNSEKTIALADIIESVDDLIKKDNEQNKTDNRDLITESKQNEEKWCKNVDDIEKVEKNVDNLAEELDFNFSEKLKDMDEISISKTDRKPFPMDFDLSAEISLLKKSGSDQDADKRNKVTNLRKNIREVMDDNQLDASTLAAQREELERLARVQEQQRMIREMQRQVALDRQNSKTQNKVLSLLTGHMSLVKSSTNAASSSKVQVTSPTAVDGDVEEILTGNLTPSVSIAPIKAAQKKTDSMEISEVSDSIETQIQADLDSNEKLTKSSDDLLIVEDEESTDEDDDDDVIELKPKKDIVTIDDSSDDDCIM